MAEKNEVDAPLLSQGDQIGHAKPHAQAVLGHVGASVDPAYDALDHEERGRHSIASLDSDLELDDMHADYHQVDGNEEIGLRAGAREDHAGPLRAEDILDRRASLESLDMWQEAARMGNRAFFKKAAINALLIGLWYVFSICISVYNKWMFSPGNLDFHYPLFTTSVHMIVQFTLSSLVLLFIPRFRPQRGAVNPHDEDAHKNPARPEENGSKKPIMTPWFYVSRIATTASVTGLDIGLGNTSLKFVTLTFFTMCKSSVLGFVLLFAILFRLEKPSWKLGAIILVMTVGVVLMVAGETAFNAIGFTLLMIASLASGLRWSLTQILLRRTPATSNPFSTLFFITPVMFLTLFILAIPIEGFASLREGFANLAESKGLFVGILILLFPGVLAFCMTSAEFALLKRTSVVTLSVCGIFKEVLTISAASIVFGDQLTPINISGLCVTLSAIISYNYIRMKKMKRQEVKKAQEIAEQVAAEENAPMLASRATANSTPAETANGDVVRRSSIAPATISATAPVQNALSSQDEDMELKKSVLE